MADARNKPPLRKRLAALYGTYGRIALVIYMVMWILTVAVFGAAIHIGFKSSSATGLLGTIGAAWLAAKMTMPLRILATIAITPPIAGWWRRRHPLPPMASELHRRIVEAAFAASGRDVAPAPPAIEDPGSAGGGARIRPRRHARHRRHAEVNARTPSPRGRRRRTAARRPRR